MTTKERTAILIINLGSPDSPEVPDVRRYLNQFLMDGRVIDVPYLLRKLIVGGIVVPFRSPKSAHAYKTIWWDEGSPLVVISKRARDALAERMTVPVALAMRYGEPSIPSVVARLAEEGMERIVVAAMYPHYAMSTIETTVVEVDRVIAGLDRPIRTTVMDPFYADPMYIDALAHTVRPHLEEPFDHLLISYHGLPERHLRKTDPTGSHCLSSPACCDSASPAHAKCYRHQVLRTSELLMRKLELPRDKYTVSFQSRLGKDSWLKPFTAEEVLRLAETGVRRLLVMCPAFVADCLETLEEINIGVRDSFLEAGGESFTMIPCLNDDPVWMDTLAALCNKALSQTGKAQSTLEESHNV